MTVDLHAEALTTTVTEMTEVCRLDDLSRERGVAALVGAVQVALFRTFDDVVYAVQQRDPYSGANVMSRGIVGSRGDTPTVASPMYKQVFDLRTGECLDPVGKEPRRLMSYPVVVRDGAVLVTGAVLAGAPRAAREAWAAGDAAGAGP
ncbi:MAG TPA: nitrite reductase small subunit NirD [Pedococcus sp.]|nr:nitrite reductase small subunit NirD [Pedococcus sp.]